MMETTCGRTRHHRRRRRSSVHGAGSWRTYAVADPPCWGEWAWRCIGAPQAPYHISLKASCSTDSPWAVPFLFLSSCLCFIRFYSFLFPCFGPSFSVSLFYESFCMFIFLTFLLFYVYFLANTCTPSDPYSTSILFLYAQTVFRTT